MQEISTPIIAQLLMDLRFAPRRKRLEQIDAAERLFELVKPGMEYPYEFICDKITGYRPRENRHVMVQGKKLREDLRIFIARLSNDLNISVNSQPQKVYTIEQLADKFDVSHKTIHRWRKRGLIGRRLVFEDGVKRLGFTEHSVKQFENEHTDLVGRAMRFRKISDQERDEIISQARQLVQNQGLSRQDVIRRLAEKQDRAMETIRYVIGDYERANPESRIFRHSTGVITAKQAAAIYKMYQEGTAIDELIQKFGRSKSSIYRLINQRRARELIARKIDYMHSDEFTSENADEKILSEPLKNLYTPSKVKPDTTNVGPDSLPQYLNNLKATQPLTRDQESKLFKRYNYLKFSVARVIEKINPSRVRSSLIKQAEAYLEEAEEIKNILIESNLRLVVSIANRHAGRGASLPDLVSEGNFSLMRAVEKFDYTRGFRFSTYASWAIAKDFARRVPAERSRPDRAGAIDMEGIQRDMRMANLTDVAAIEDAHKSLEHVIRDNLNSREQYIIMNHFGLDQRDRRKGDSLKSIGEELGLSKERVRQLELAALQKLRQCLSPEEFELFVG